MPPLLSIPSGDLVTTAAPLLKFGEVGILGAVTIAVLIVIHRIVEKSRDNEFKRSEQIRAAESSRLTDQLNAVSSIATTNLETAKIQAATQQAATLLVRELERHTESLEAFINRHTVDRPG